MKTKLCALLKTKLGVLFVLMLLLVVVATPVLAVLGVGDIVHDPISYLNALAMLQQLLQSYDELKAQTGLEIWMSQMLPIFDTYARYGLPGTNWTDLRISHDRFGNLAGWSDAVNLAGSAEAGYAGASVELRPYGPKFAELHPDEQARIASNYASVELADGTNVNTLEAVGTLRANAIVTEQAIENLTADAFSKDPEMNTLIGVLNVANAALVSILRSGRDSNRALLSLLEQQVSESKLRRDAHAAELNVQSMRLEQADAAKAAYTSTIDESLRAFRWSW